MKEPKIRFKGFCGEWEEKKLFHIVNSISSGKDTPSKGNYSLYGSTGVIGSVKNPSHNGPLLLVARVGANAGHIQLIDEECGITDNTLIVSPQLGTSLNYLYFFFQQLNLNKLVYGSGQPLITGGMLKNIDIRMGNEDECHIITKFFQHLDTLIQSITKKIESLKQVKAASLQSMFPQEGETKPRVRFKGFEGDWEKVAIKDIATINPKTNIPNIFEYVDLESVVGTELKSHRTETKQTAPSRAQRLASNGDIFYQTVRPYQKNNFYFDLNENNFVFSSGYAQIRANLCGSFLFALMQQNSFVLKVMDNCTGTSFPAINANVLGTLEIMVTKNIVEQTAIASYFTNLDKQITLQTQRLEKLKQIKSACLDNMFV